MLEVLRSRRLVARAARCAEFEAAFAARLGAEHVSAVSSGTAGLHLAHPRRRRRGAATRSSRRRSRFVASANSVLYEGARPVFCDIDPRTLNIDPAAAAAAVGERTTGLLPVHIFGYPADMPAFEALAAERGLWIVEDACEALGAVHGDGTLVGARGNLAVFAFYPNKQLTTGEGGMVIAPLGGAQGSGSTPSATRAARPTWAGSTTTGSASTTASSDLACALGHRAARAARRDARRPRARRGAVRATRSARHRGPRAALPATRTATGAAGSSTSSSCRAGVDRDATIDGAARARRRRQAVPAGDPPR